MILDKNTNILIIGLGVIGGGYAAGLTNAGYKVNCITKEQKDVDYALERGIISRGSVEVDSQMVNDADLIIFAVYPRIFIDWVKKYQHLFKSGAIITDVTGVKSKVVNTVQNILRKDVEYIPAHPMAGRESSGVEFSDPNVFKGANYIITPTEKNTEHAVEVCKEIGEILGFAKISKLSVEDHDQMIAFLSQLTHCIAVTLMTCNDTPDLEKYTGDSFRDLTRIAKINDKMWSELFIMNKERLLENMDAFIEEFKLFRKLLSEENEEEMRSKMRKATQRRLLFDKPKNK